MAEIFNIHDWPIRNKLLMIVLAMVALSLGLVMAGIVSYELGTYRKRMVRELTEIGGFIASNSATALAFEDPQTAREILGTLRSSPGVAVAVLYNAKGELFASYRRSVETKLPSLPSPGEQGLSFKDNYLKLVRDVEQKGRRIGTLVVNVDMAAVNERLAGYAGIFLVVSLAIAAGAVLLQRLLQHLVSEPLVRLSGMAETIARGDLTTRIEVESKDEIGHLAATINHMTAELAKSYEKLQLSEQHYRILFDRSPLPKWTLDIKTYVILEVNDAAVSHYGYSRDEFRHMTFADIGTPDDFAKFKAWVDECCREGNKFEGQLQARHRKKNDEIIDVVSQFVEIDYKGRRAALFAVIDITERKKAVEALRESENRYRTLFNSIDEGFCIIQLVFARDGKPVDYVFLETNPSFEKHTGLVDANGKRMRELSPQHEEHWYEVYGRVASTGEPIRFENHAELLNRWYDVYAFRFGAAGNRQVAILFNDITRRKESEVELRRAKDELEARVAERTRELAGAMERLRSETEERIQAVEELRRKEQLLIQQSRLAAMGEMLVNISHQWRQPLNLLGLILQDLDRTYRRGSFSPEFVDSSVDRAMQVIEHMSRTIDDFRNFFIPDKSTRLFSVREVVETTVSMIRDSFKDLRPDLRIEARDDVSILGYRNEYAQVVMNILINARDVFRERKVASPVIVVKIVAEEGRSVVTIADNAGGIAGEVIDRIFDPYFTTKDPDQGTGVGLFMSKTIIEKNMKGSLTVRNTGIGAEFRIEV